MRARVSNTILGPFKSMEEALEGIEKFLTNLAATEDQKAFDATGLCDCPLCQAERDQLVPPSGVEPELPKEPHFECGASANSARGAVPVPPDADDPYWQNMGPGSMAGGGRITLKIDGNFPEHMVRCLENIELPFGWTIEARMMWLSAAVARAEYQVRVVCGPTMDNMTGAPMEGWNGRWWRLSQFMTDGEIVQTVFKAVMTALEHEARELFLYKGVSVLDPHFDINKMAEFRRDPSSILGRS